MLIVTLSVVGQLGVVGQYFKLVLLLRCCRVVRLFGKVSAIKALAAAWLEMSVC